MITLALLADLSVSFFPKKEPPRVDARERQIVVEKTEGLKVQPHELGFLKFGNGGELTQVFWRMRS
jgi:hypothetical protein